MTTTMVKTAAVFFLWALSLPTKVSILMSLFFGFYIVNMLYFNIVKIHFSGSWKSYFKAILKPIKNKLIAIWQRLRSKK